MDNIYNHTNKQESEYVDYLFIFLLLGFSCLTACFKKNVCIRNKKNINIKTNLIENSNSDCCICLEPLKKNEKIAQLECEHTFHKDCIKTWLNLNNTCPTCRLDV